WGAWGAWEEADIGTVPVQRLGPGDHAFASYGDDASGWDVLATFTAQGVIRGEKVLIFPAPQLPEAEVRDRLEGQEGQGQGASLTAASERGQVVLTSMRALIHPQPRFTPERQWERIGEETERAVAEGYRGLRAFIDMHWVPDLAADVEVMMYRESHAEHLFSDRPYTEVCTYDRRWFAPDVLAAMHQAHPRDLLPRLGELRVLQSADSVHLIGEADAATREPFRAALRTALARVADRPLLVDLSPLAFLSARCAADLLQLAADAPGQARIEVRCAPAQARVLRALGADTPRLTVSEVNRAW
ncbi:MEDS domain-containing protein, partial [Streptomyces sp. E11-3]|uniref:MEDS domain-containing protein n=1 Tax=Streptomyces sp. E11-3 TaxID=3110112 RepID=UPI00397FCC72